jgi:hypothetical protein
MMYTYNEPNIVRRMQGGFCCCCRSGTRLLTTMMLLVVTTHLSLSISPPPHDVAVLIPPPPLPSNLISQATVGESRRWTGTLVYRSVQQVYYQPHNCHRRTIGRYSRHHKCITLFADIVNATCVTLLFCLLLLWPIFSSRFPAYLPCFSVVDLVIPIHDPHPHATRVRGPYYSDMGER